MKKILVIVILLNSLILHAQFEFVAEIKIDADKFNIDILGNFYLLKNNIIQKTDNELNNIANYDTKKYGTLSLFDASNPFTILLFYTEINKIVFLDNHLNELRTAISLDNLNIYNSNILCNSIEGFWIFDMQNSNAILFDKDLSKRKTSPNLFQLIENDTPILIKETNNFLILQLDSGKMIILDHFANYYKTININSKTNFDTYNDKIYTIKENKIFVYNLKTNMEVVYENPINQDIINFKISNSYIYFLTKNILIKYKITNP